MQSLAILIDWSEYRGVFICISFTDFVALNILMDSFAPCYAPIKRWDTPDEADHFCVRSCCLRVESEAVYRPTWVRDDVT